MLKKQSHFTIEKNQSNKLNLKIIFFFLVYFILITYGIQKHISFN